MRIACLQFAPRTGDVDFNLSRADSVLSKADQASLDDIDLLVLPELAFTGSNFKSLKEISTYFEPSTSGITALWARTTALRYNSTVAVGYPEKVDVTSNWPTSPEFYNSLVVVNGDGETVANIRKKSLTASDKKWALESKEDGFVTATIEGIGQTTMGISTDLFTSTSECEFALHVIEAASRVILVTMSWAAQDEARTFSRTPSEPDMDALTSWTQQLLPLIKTEGPEEVIVVFCNRCGFEDGVAYSGTSAVLGIKDGEVSVYGLLGRGVKELLVVDTDAPPFAKLVQADTDQLSETHYYPSVLRQRSTSSFKQSQLSPGLVLDSTWPSLISDPDKSTKPRPTTPTRFVRHRTREGSPTTATVRASKTKSKIPSIQIPGRGSPAVRATIAHNSTTHEIEIPWRDTNPEVETPTYPSPTPDRFRPQIITAPVVSRNLPQQVPSQFAVLGADIGGVATDLHVPLSPTTPFLEFFRNTSPSSPMSQFCFHTSPLQSPQVPRNQENQLYWVPPRQLLKSPTSTTMSPSDTPIDKIMTMFSVCAPTSLAEDTFQVPPKAHILESKQVPTHTSGSPPRKNETTAESFSRSNARKATERESTEIRIPNSTLDEPCDKGILRGRPAEIPLEKPRSHSTNIHTLSTTPHKPTLSSDRVPDAGSRSGAPSVSETTKRSHSNDSFHRRSSPPFTRPRSRRAQTRHLSEHHRSRSLIGYQRRGRQDGNCDTLQQITFTSGEIFAQQTGSGTSEGQGGSSSSSISSPASDSHLRGRLPEISRPSSIPRQRRERSNGVLAEPSRPSSIPRQRWGTSNRGDLRSRDGKAPRPDYDPNEIIATISKITTDCPHHSANRPLGPVVQSADGSLYTIELPQHVQDLAMSLFNKLPADTRLNSRQSLVRKSLVW